jgi:diguanylate cyclase (GGDEF)-like protein
MNDLGIQGNFLSLLAEDQIKIESAWNSLRSDKWDSTKATALAQAAHRLAGAALTVGYTSIGNTARNLENAIRHTGVEPDWQTLQALVEDLKKACIDQKMDTDQIKHMAQYGQAISPQQNSQSTGKVYIVDDDPAQVESLAAQVSRFGYEVHVFTQLSNLRNELRHEIPIAILMDIVFPEGELAGAEEIRNLRQEFGDQLPVFFISVRDDTAARIQAIRAGGKGYFTKPVDIDALMDEINKLSVQVDPQPYRVLIVDDSEIQAKTNALHLRKVNMETNILSQSADILVELENFRPDLLLLDLYMPDYTGLELALMIRQIKAYVGLPIVFLSAETDREKQLNAVGQGGDDFLTKPIKPDLLIASVTSRIERYRKLQTLMLRDGLTGLFNHTTMREHLMQEINRAGRANQPFALAMLDIDEFKKVNDNYGHATGDKVLRSLAHMLSLRLRRTDIMGRYGGEEFIVILPNTTIPDALLLIDNLRESFAQIVHLSQGMEFRVTISGGVAGFPQLDNASDLSEAADRAMYCAKRQGRNRVTAAQDSPL